MSESLEEVLQSAEAQLIRAAESLPRAQLMTDYHHGEYFLRGNSAALIALAVDALRSVRGEKAVAAYNLRNESWEFCGFWCDENTSERTREAIRFRWKWNRRDVGIYAVIAAVLLLLFTGLFTFVRWIVLAAQAYIY